MEWTQEMEKEERGMTEKEIGAFSAKRELIQCKITVSDWSLSRPSLWLSFIRSCYSFLTHPHTGPHTPDCYCYWLPKLPLNFHFAVRLVYVPAPLVHSHKPQEALLAGWSMSHNPRRSERRTDCGCSGSHFFLPLLVFCTCLSRHTLNFSKNTNFFPSYGVKETDIIL